MVLTPDRIKLFIDGKEAFPELKRLIRQAQKSIFINMFIWRDDDIGNEIAAELLAAAGRGVSVEISKDTYGTVCEYSEEDQSSFFHKHLTVTELIKIYALILTYNPKRFLHKLDIRPSDLADRLVSHPNVRLHSSYREDHSKFYIFDDKTLFLGGINVEDKENGTDQTGRVYQDYMVEICDEDAVSAFLKARKEPGKSASPLFGMNVKKPERFFEMKERYLKTINEAKENLTVVMAYFAPVKEFVDALVNAVDRGVEVTVLMPESANFTDASNKRTVNTLLEKSDGRIKILLSDKMVHTKLIMTEKEITLGSTNISKKAFSQLDELNVFIPNECAFAERIKQSVSENMATSKVTGKVKYNRLVAFFESLLV